MRQKNKFFKTIEIFFFFNLFLRLQVLADFQVTSHQLDRDVKADRV